MMNNYELWLVGSGVLVSAGLHLFALTLVIVVRSWLEVERQKRTFIAIEDLRDFTPAPAHDPEILAEVNHECIP